jgi:hypothetical protein
VRSQFQKGNVANGLRNSDFYHAQRAFARKLFMTHFETNGTFLCGPMRISAFSGLK